MLTKTKPVEIEREDDDEATYAVGNAKIHIRRDSDPLNPRTEWDNAWTWYSNSSRHFFDRENGKALTLSDILPDDYRDEDHLNETLDEAVLRNNHELLDAVKIYMYEHSGVTVSLGSFSDPWDSGVGAVAVITRKKAEECWPDLKGDDEKLKEAAYNCLKSEVETFDRYLQNEVYGYVVESEDGEGDSCWGFYEDPEDIVKEASVTVKDATLRKLGGLDIINEMNEKQRTHFSRVSWTDEAKDGEELYTVSVSLEAEYTETYGDPDALAKQLGYQRGEFDGHILLVWNETEETEETEETK